jgi:hypothetical protein
VVRAKHGHFFFVALTTHFLSSAFFEKSQQVSRVCFDRGTTNRTTLPVELVWFHETSTQRLQRRQQLGLCLQLKKKKGFGCPGFSPWEGTVFGRLIECSKRNRARVQGQEAQRRDGRG